MDCSVFGHLSWLSSIYMAYHYLCSFGFI